MQLAFTLFKYFPYGGLQRDFLRIALACQARGHAIRVYTLSWQGDIPAGFEVVQVPVKALTNPRRYEKFAAWVGQDLTQRPADRVEILKWRDDVPRFLRHRRHGTGQRPRSRATSRCWPSRSGMGHDDRETRHRPRLVGTGNGECERPAGSL